MSLEPIEYSHALWKLADSAAAGENTLDAQSELYDEFHTLYYNNRDLRTQVAALRSIVERHQLDDGQE